MLEIRNLSISFDKVIFNDANFVCHDGEIVTVCGESGCGKTTLLRFIMGDIKADGILLYHGKEIDNRDEFLFNDVSYVDQMGSYFPNMSVYGHFDFYAKIHHMTMNKNIAKEYLKKVHLEYLSLKAYPSQLSTGERKRMLLALALMMKKKIIIMDEPTASLDQRNIESLLDNIQELSNEGMTFIIATHDQEVVDISDCVYHIHDKQLEKIKNNEKIDSDDRNETIDPKKISYLGYKNMRMKIFIVLIILIGGLGFSYISKTIVSNILLQTKANEQVVDASHSSILYFVKSIDPRYSLESSMRGIVDDDYEAYGQLDIINEEDLDKVKEIDGVKEVLPVCYLSQSTSSSIIQVYQNNHFVKNASKLATDRYGFTFERTCYVVAYYPEENIKKDGKLIDGIYINELFAEMIDMESLDNVDISLDVYCHIGLYKGTNGFEGTDEYGLPYISSDVENAQLTLSIDGILHDSEYDDGKFNQYGKIYVPIDMFNEIIENYFETNENADMSYQPRQYKIICEAGKSEDIKLAIEDMNELYYANNANMSNNSIVQQAMNIQGSGLLMTVIIGIVIIAGTILLNIYYISQRKQEMILLRREGLSSCIPSYLRQDNIVIILGWMIISAIVLYVVWTYFEGMKFAYSIYSYSLTWMICVIVIGMIVLLIKMIYEKKMIRQVIADD